MAVLVLVLLATVLVHLLLLQLGFTVGEGALTLVRA